MSGKRKKKPRSKRIADGMKKVDWRNFNFTSRRQVDPYFGYLVDKKYGKDV